MSSRAAHQYFTDILNAIQHTEDLVSGKSFEQYQQDRTIKRAVERLLMIVTEASILLTEEDKKLCGYTEWRSMRNLGNRLRHAYFALDDLQIWLTLQDDFPPLKAAVEQTLREHFPGSPRS
jgi:uncharacterized protein with HEPN domain